MKSNVQVKNEPVELQVNELLRLYGYNLTKQSSNRSSRSKPIILNNNNNNTNNNDQQQQASKCAWCQKLGIRSFTLRTENDESKTLCSEVCFNQYRRASFKKNKNSELDIDHSIFPIPSTIKNKVEFKHKKTEHKLLDPNRRKILLPVRRSTSTRPKSQSTNLNTTCSSPLSTVPASSVSFSSSPSSDVPVSLTWQSSFVLPPNISWPSSIDLNHYNYPLLTPSIPPQSQSQSTSSSLFTTLAKGTLSNLTCILPTFIPVPIPIPIPLSLPLSFSCKKCSSIEVSDKQCQTIMENETDQKRTRRISV